MEARFFAFFLIFSKFAKVFVPPSLDKDRRGERTDTWTTAYFMHLPPGVYPQQAVMDGLHVLRFSCSVF